ncbi:hypothetical protein [Streptomyces sp. G1]|nr:hypothetical protein [Streptomyces sp. G1]MCM1973013.1 hypothetical protein [Streptomyces sp. G1]MCX5126987.1 hypothetical protein [Streptomyces sp. NBC_00347]
MAGLLAGTALLAGGVAHADDAGSREATVREHVDTLTADIEQENPYRAQLPPVTKTLSAPRPGRDIPIEVDFTANEDSKTAQLDVAAGDS